MVAQVPAFGPGFIVACATANLYSFTGRPFIGAKTLLYVLAVITFLRFK